MRAMKLQGLKVIFLLGTLACMMPACRKLIEIDEPVNTLTTSEIFSSDATATAAMAAIYSTMINGANTAISAFGTEFSAGLTTSRAGASADELYSTTLAPNGGQEVYRTNKLTGLNADPTLWSSAYDVIYKANSVIEGVAASTSPALHDEVRQRLTGQAKFIRAFCYFYLTNFYGDVPMALTVDFNRTASLPRMPQAKVYEQIISDLKDAQAVLPQDYAEGKGERTLPNKWAATLMLARAYLYARDYNDAGVQAGSIIANTALFALEADLTQVYTSTSREAVWQLKPTNEDPQLKNATPEGYAFSPSTLDHHGAVGVGLTNELLSAFEPNDQRRVIWVDSTDFPYNNGNPTAWTFYPNKYVIGAANGIPGAPSPQYYTVLRWAEAYLIRAEANANGAPGGAGAAIDDVNTIRRRAGLPDLDNSLNGQQLANAIAKERQIEFFAEWGHRWFDLKRTGQANAVLSVIAAKQPWLGEGQLLYPIPVTEITADHFLTQNAGY